MNKAYEDVKKLLLDGYSKRYIKKKLLYLYDVLDIEKAYKDVVSDLEDGVKLPKGKQKAVVIERYNNLYRACMEDRNYKGAQKALEMITRLQGVMEADIIVKNTFEINWD